LEFLLAASLAGSDQHPEEVLQALVTRLEI